MMNKEKLTVTISLLLMGAFVTFAEQQTFTGVLTDSMCGATHMAKDKSPAECTRMCVKDGMKYELAADKKLYTLEGHEAEMSKLAGQRVTIKGTLNGDTVYVESVLPAK